MNRKKILGGTALALLSGLLARQQKGFGNDHSSDYQKSRKKFRNIIFMVSDGMSAGTLTMADLLLQRNEVRKSNWLKLYKEEKIARVLMDTASANSLVTDSSAASSVWGSGFRWMGVNGSLC